MDHATVRNPLLVERGIKSMLGVPLLAGGKVIGVLHVGSLSGRPFGREDIELLQLAADRAALALHSMMAQDDAPGRGGAAPQPAPRDAARAARHWTWPRATSPVPATSAATGTTFSSCPDGKLGIVVGDVAGSGLAAAVIMGRMRSALRAYVLETADPATVLRLLDRKIQYFEPDAMATVLYGLYDPRKQASSPSPWPATSRRCWPRRAGARPAMLPVKPDPPIGVTADARRAGPPRPRSRRARLLCCFTDGLVERRDQPIDAGIGRVAATLDQLDAGAPR